MAFETVIGLEVHAQLSTRSKIFCACSTAFGAAPNGNTCPVCTGMPGVLPVLNRKAVEFTIRTALAASCTVQRRSVFARKNYFYPDLPKAYQISQYELPIALGGHIDIEVDGGTKRVGITRIHMEEDAGKLVHEGEFAGAQASLADLNRCSVPLMEIVSEPDMRTPEEGGAYLRRLHDILVYLDVCDGNMEEGSFRCDANVSVRRPGEPLGTRREIKNLNSFRFMQQAIDFEVQWQINEIEEGRAIRQATVLFDPDSGETRAMRSKEDAHDYRYFPDPDLLPLEITADWIAQVKSGLPELPQAMQQRFGAECGLSSYDAAALTASREIAAYFEAVLASAGKENAKLVANWVMGDLSARLNKDGLEISAVPLAPTLLAGIIRRIADNTISNKIARDVFEALWAGDGKDADAVIEAKGWKQITDTGAIEALVDEVLAANQKSVEEYRAGKEKAFNALVGQAMKATRGKANPQQVTDLLKKKLGA